MGICPDDQNVSADQPVAELDSVSGGRRGILGTAQHKLRFLPVFVEHVLGIGRHLLVVCILCPSQDPELRAQVRDGLRKRLLCILIPADQDRPDMAVPVKIRAPFSPAVIVEDRHLAGRPVSLVRPDPHDRHIQGPPAVDLFRVRRAVHKHSPGSPRGDHIRQVRDPLVRDRGDDHDRAALVKESSDCLRLPGPAVDKVPGDDVFRPEALQGQRAPKLIEQAVIVPVLRLRQTDPHQGRFRRGPGLLLGSGGSRLCLPGSLHGLRPVLRCGFGDGSGLLTAASGRQQQCQQDHCHTRSPFQFLSAHRQPPSTLTDSKKLFYYSKMHRKMIQLSRTGLKKAGPQLSAAVLLSLLILIKSG